MRYQDPPVREFPVTRKLLVVITATVASACANADSDLYAGAGLTEGRASNVYGLNLDCRGCPVWGLDATSWEVLFGWRPIRPFAVEAKYESLGDSAVRLSHGHASLDASAAGVYAIGFLPLPQPVLDLYVKVGMVRSELSGRSYTFDPRSDTRIEPAMGAGVQAHSRRVGVRLEYEHFNIPQTTHAYVYSIAATYDLH
jgi:hypothetical protein